VTPEVPTGSGNVCCWGQTGLKADITNPTRLTHKRHSLDRNLAVQQALTKQAAQAVSRFTLQGNSALLRGDRDGPVKLGFGFVAPTA
jgi:hypothetical protein